MIETNALELRLDAIEAQLTEMARQAEERALHLLRAVESAVERVLAAHEDDRQVRADIADALGRIGRIEALCPECPRRPSPTPPPNGDGP